MLAWLLLIKIDFEKHKPVKPNLLGNKVFENYDTPLNNPDHGWDGRFKGQMMSPGVYGWVVEVEFVDGERMVYKGNTTLIR
mgnify:CR=1 FL=1